MSSLFALHAPHYWAKGIPVIPLQRNSKRPVPQGWSVYADKMPSAEMQNSWLTTEAGGNIGLPLGPQSGMIAVDIDTDEPTVCRVLDTILPNSPWRRVGKKGAVLAYKFSGQRTFRIKGADGKTLVEVLSAGTQIVLPPSIHPDTMAPYEANCNLMEVIGNLPVLPPDLEILLRGALEEAGVALSQGGSTRISEFVPQGARDNAMVAHAGILARAVTRGERTLLEALSEMEHWCSNFIETVAGDPIDVDKGKQRVIQFLLRDVLGERRAALPTGWDVGLTDDDKRQMGVLFSEEHVQWTFIQMREYLQAEFERHSPDSLGRSNAVEYVINRMARSPNLSKIDEDRLLKWITNSSQLGVSMGALRKRLVELRQGDLAGDHHSEIAEAVLKELRQFGDVRFHGSNFWQWKGADWQVLADEAILRHVAENYGHYPAAKRFSDHQGILKVMRSVAAGALREKDIPGINFANGFLTSRLELLPHHPAYGMTYTLPYRYLPELAGAAHRFQSFMQGVWGEDEDYVDKVKALQQAIASTLFGRGPYFSRAICLHGIPNSGKTEMLKIVQGLMPQTSISAVPPSDWGDKFLPTEMHEKLLNICGELSEKKKIDGQMFKLIVEGAEINGQKKGQQIFKFRPICAHWFATNHLPKTGDTSAGFNRRWLILHFGKPVSKEERVNGIGDMIIAEEREAIVAWAVEAIQELERNMDYTLPASHQKLIAEVANDNNSVRYFLTASGKVKIGAPLATVKADGSKSVPRISEMKLHDAYYTFCVGAGAAVPVRPNTFRHMMRELTHEFGFSLEIGQNSQGVEMAEYLNITLVGDRTSAAA